MKFNALLLYINERAKADKLKDLQADYDSNMLCCIRQYCCISATGKEEKGLKMWTEIVNKINGITKEDTRTSDDIINDTLKKFKE